MRIALLGAGDVARRHVEGLLRAGDVQLVTLRDPHADRVASPAADFELERVDNKWELTYRQRTPESRDR